MTARVQTVLVNPGDAALKDVLRQEFGDTRHRSVTYTITAASRFRQFFDRREPAQAFVVVKKLDQPVNILSSARPPVPVVLSASPAFAWTQGTQAAEDGAVILRRTRTGGHVRIEIERPWYQTGDGEQLAVMVSTDGRPPLEVSPYVTQAGRDPIQDTGMPPRWPTADMFAAAASAGASALVAELGESVDFVPYEAWFHNDRWYVDVVMPTVAASSVLPVRPARGRAVSAR